ncbi:MAG TPA: DNA repair protein RadA [Alphaproteobacteria bacterium]|nr:DNA repair protein RadA [Alphaproteobacteria bacterium]
MAKVQTLYFCSSCGTSYPKWSGKCEACGSWNTLSEERTTSKSIKTNFQSLEFENLETGSESSLERLTTVFGEFNRVCGGGLVPGGVVLVGGDPGIGKSTLLLQVAADLSKKATCAYISGEESTSQIRLRAKRLGFEKEPLHLASHTILEDILTSLKSIKDLKVVIIDSIQTMCSQNLESAPGTVSQVRQCTQDLIQFAKSQNICVILVGHVTKEGTLAGPRVLEHMVDTVLYFEGQRDHYYRLLRCVKNRFGPTDELGVFEMVEKGLKEVKNPSALFLPHHQDDVSGSAIAVTLEGTRPLLIELQALVANSFLAAPRRTSVGYDLGRLNMILAVLEARCNLRFSNKDVYLNVAGGLKLSDTAADLAVASALISSLSHLAIPKGCIFFGELGLAGEVRPVIQPDLRLKEAEKMGFSHGFFAKNTKTQSHLEKNSPLSYLKDLLPIMGLTRHSKEKEQLTNS